MQKIIPFLWFDNEAEEAAEFYTSIFENSRIENLTRYLEAGQEIHGQQPGSVMTVEFEIEGYKMIGLNGGPHFHFNPSVSFFVNFDPSRDKNARKKLDRLWENLSEGGKALMPLDTYPFSEHYGWIEDKYGISWQLILTNPEGEERPVIVPSLLFVRDVCGKAEEAMNFYLDLFMHSQPGLVARYPAGMEPDREGTVMYGDFMLENQWFAAMDSAQEHDFSFNEAISLQVLCDTQEEVDFLWENLSAVPEAEQCGWLKDKFGVSWQIVPIELPDLLSGDRENAEQVTETLLGMKKIDINQLKNISKGIPQ